MDLNAALKTAVEEGLVRDEGARLILKWHRGGHIAAPTQRAAAMAREVLTGMGSEMEVAVVECAAEPELPPSEAPRKAASSTGGAARKPRSAAARSRIAAAWATREPLQAGELLIRNRDAVLALLADDAKSHRDKVGKALQLPSPADWMSGGYHPAEAEAFETVLGNAVRLLQQLPSTVEVDGEPLSVLAAAREALGADQRTKGVFPATPQVRVVEPPEDTARLPKLVAESSPEEQQMVLPTLRAAKRRNEDVGPAPWLQVFDRLGGRSMEPGRGAPLALRLWVEGLAAAPPAARFGRSVHVPLTVRDLRDALWPEGWQRTRQLPRLREAMRAINALGFFGVPGGEIEWAPVLWRSLPDRGSTLDTTVLLLVHLPRVRGAGIGARFNRDVLRLLGLRSAPMYRLYLALVAEWDRKLQRGIEPHKAEGDSEPRPLPGFSPAERRRLIFGADKTAGVRATIRSRQRDADRAFEALARQGVIDLDRDSDDPRIWRPSRRDLDS